MRTLIEVLQLTTEYLRCKGVEHPRREAEWLLVDALELKGRMHIYMDHDRPLDEAELSLCRRWLARRGAGEPLQYIRGYVDFFGCRLLVDRRVLIPRQETEILVDSVRKDLVAEDLTGKVLWDLCCGSGCIAIALKRQFPALTVIGSDISEEALAVAVHNASVNEVEVEWCQGDLLQPLEKRSLIDYVIVNPPYISVAEMATLSLEVRDNEPHLALEGGVDGLSFYRRLAEGLPACLVPGGRVWLEIGASQGAAVSELFKGAFWQGCSVHKDLAGHDRIVTATRTMSANISGNTSTSANTQF